MAEDRVVFDFTDKKVLNLFLKYKPGIESNDEKQFIEYKTLKKKSTKIKKVIDLSSKVKVLFTNSSNNEYCCIYKKASLKNIKNDIIYNHKIDIKGCYVEELDLSDLLNEEIFKFDARFSFFQNSISINNLKIVKSDTMFYFSEFNNSNINFSRTEFFDGELSFHYADLGSGSINFNQVHMDLRYCSFLRVGCNKATFKNMTIKPSTNLKFKDINLIKIHHCTIENTVRLEKASTSFSISKSINLGQIYFSDEPSVIVSAIENSFKEDKELTNKQKLDQLTLIKENYHQLGDYDGEDFAYRTYMKYKTSAKWYKRPMKFFNLVGGYGTKPLRIIIAMLVTMFGFAGVYSVFFMNQFKEVLTTFWDTLYYSGITFLTIGYGDISPAFEGSTALRFVSVAEGFIGLFLMSYLTVAVVRKLLR